MPQWGIEPRSAGCKAQASETQAQCSRNQIAHPNLMTTIYNPNLAYGTFKFCPLLSRVRYFATPEYVETTGTLIHCLLYPTPYSHKGLISLHETITLHLLIPSRVGI